MTCAPKTRHVLDEKYFSNSMLYFSFEGPFLIHACFLSTVSAYNLTQKILYIHIFKQKTTCIIVSKKRFHASKSFTFSSRALIGQFLPCSFFARKKVGHYPTFLGDCSAIFFAEKKSSYFVSRQNLFFASRRANKFACWKSGFKSCKFKPTSQH